MNRVTNTNLLFCVLTYQSLNGAIPSIKCFIKAPAKCKTSIYVLMENHLQWCKWLGPCCCFSIVTLKLFYWCNACKLRQIYTCKFSHYKYLRYWGIIDHLEKDFQKRIMFKMKVALITSLIAIVSSATFKGEYLDPWTMFFWLPKTDPCSNGQQNW